MGKTTLARIFGEYINSEVIEINGADSNGVDDVRGWVSAASYRPAFNDYRMFIVDECHLLTNAAWNAMLKILEETPKTTVWVLCTTELNKIPITIKTRSTIVPLRLITRQAAMNYITNICNKEGVKVDTDVLKHIVDRANGRLREAVTQYETYVNSGNPPVGVSNLEITTFFYNLFKGNALECTNFIERCSSQDVPMVISFINDYLKLVILRQQLDRTIPTDQILDEYTKIGSYNLDALRELQGAVWQCAGDGEQWVASVKLLYSVYDRLMAHYNDFRDGRLALSVATLSLIGELYE